MSDPQKKNPFQTLYSEVSQSDAYTSQKGVHKRDKWAEANATNKAAKMRDLLVQSATQTLCKAASKPVANPIWLTFPTRCVEPVTSEDHMRRLLKYHTQSADVMVVRYWQENCTACNAMDKVMEALCHEAKQSFPDAHFYDVQKEKHPSLVAGMVAFPQVKAFAGGQWADISFKPPQYFRDETYKKVAEEVRRLSEEDGTVVDAVQAEEMYFSASGPALLTCVRDSVSDFYIKSKVRMHNYWKQVSVRRTWFFRKYIEPQYPKGSAEHAKQLSVFGEVVEVSNPAPGEKEQNFLPDQHQPAKA
jgi:hypothetical protein